jgi:hypothetical protein
VSGLIGAFSDLAACVACDAVRQTRLGEISDLGQAEQYMASAMNKFFESYGPTLAAKLTEMAKPATEKAMEVVRPQIEQALKDWTPTFAAITGGMVALSVLLGVYISKRTYEGRRR